VEQRDEDRAPEAPIGWPSATAPPFTLTFVGSRSRTRRSAIAATENASLISCSSKSEGFFPSFVAQRRTDTSGAIMTHSGAQPPAA
jgi:hypothetical protein